MTSTQYYRIPATVIQDRNLSFFARLLYGVILSLSKRKGNCFSHNLYFSELLGVSEQYISKAIKELNEKYANVIQMCNNAGAYNNQYMNNERDVTLTVLDSYPDGAHPLFVYYLTK